MAKCPLPLLDYKPPLEPYLEIIHIDDHILVLNKQSGLLSVPGKAAEHSDCLEKRAREQYPEAFIVHRLDMATSGVIVLARSKDVLRNLGLQFERRKTAKTYVARVWGHIKEDCGRIDLPLRCDWENRPRQMVDFELGRPAQTDWEVLEREDGNITRVKLTPITGRSHQLRVHMLELGHPILGDNFYDDGDALKAASRLQLHAESLTIHHPENGERKTYISVCPF